MLATLSWRPFRIPLRSPFGAAHGSLSARDGLLVRITTTSGETGFGEASPLPSFGGGSVGEAARALAGIAAQARGRRLVDLWEARFDLGNLSPGSAGATRCGFEMAVASILARRTGQPLCRWLAAQAGVELAPGPIVIPVNAVIDASDPAVAAAHSLAAVAHGYTTLKVKVGLDAPSDVSRVAAIREAVGPGIALRVDANGGWSDGRVAVGALKGRSVIGAALCEQPLAPAAGLESMAEVRRRSSVPLAIDEGCRSTGDLLDAIRAGAADAVIVKPMVTGLREALALLAVARAEGLAAIVTTTFDSGLGTMLASHLAALLPEPRPACGLSTLEFLERDIVADVPPIRSGLLTVPGIPGSGVTLDEAALALVGAGPWGEAPR